MELMLHVVTIFSRDFKLLLFLKLFTEMFNSYVGSLFRGSARLFTLPFQKSSLSVLSLSPCIYIICICVDTHIVILVYFVLFLVIVMPCLFIDTGTRIAIKIYNLSYSRNLIVMHK